jgi:hypothetical protein
MADTKLPISGNIRLLWALPNAFADYKSPTTAELNAALDIADAVSWNDFDFGIQASTQTADPSLRAKGNVQDRGSAQFGGGISFYFPGRRNDDSNLYSLVEEAIHGQRIVGYIIMSWDGDIGAVTPTYPGGATFQFADGDWGHVFKVMTDGEARAITGEEAFRYTQTFLSQGDFQAFFVAHTGPVVVEITPATATVSAATPHALLTATVQGRNFTRGVRWSSSNPAAVVVSANGVATRVGAGEAVITALHEPSGATDTATITAS